MSPKKSYSEGAADADNGTISGQASLRFPPKPKTRWTQSEVHDALRGQAERLKHEPNLIDRLTEAQRELTNARERYEYAEQESERHAEGLEAAEQQVKSLAREIEKLGLVAQK